MEDEIDIYADLPNFNLEDNENLAEKNKKLSEKCMKLEKDIADLTQSLESLKKINNNLEVNLSSLLQTARAEIARKDRMISEMRRELDNMQFRRGNYSRSTKQSRHSPRRIKREDSPKELKPGVEILPEIIDTTEFVCSNPPPSVNDGDKRTNNQFDGIVNTVFGERLRKRIINELEEERKVKEQSRTKAEMESEKVLESIKPNPIIEIERDVESGLKTDSGKSERRVNSPVRLRNNKGYNLDSKNNYNSGQKNDRLPKSNYSDRKRQLEDQAELACSYKKSKSNDGKSRYRDNSRNREEGNRSNNKNSSRIKSDDKITGKDVIESDKLRDYHILDEYEAPVDNNIQIKSETIDKTVDNYTEDRHNRVAIRLMLLAEGIDPDIEDKKSSENEERVFIDDKLKESCRKREESSRSRSKSRNRRRNHRSRSRTPDEYWKNKKRSRQNEDRYSRRSKDRFERRREAKNKDGDNLSEFSREICELKERIEHRGGDRSNDRGAQKGRSFNKQKKKDERICRMRSRTPDRSRSGSKEGTAHRSSKDKLYGRSLQSRGIHESRNRGKRYSNSDDGSIQRPKTVLPETERTENVEIIPEEVSSKDIIQNPETKSLLSLEDGEIVDSGNSSPVKTVHLPIQNLIEKVLPPVNCKPNASESDELATKIFDVNPSLPLRDIGNNQNNEKPSLPEKPEAWIPERNRSDDSNESLNCSKDERIENIAEFIANFGTDVSESRKEEKLNEEVKVPLGSRFIINTDFQDSKEDCNPLSSPIENPNAHDSGKNVNGNNVDDDWCLIALDSPVKNFEENRKNRIIAQNLQMLEKLEPIKIVTSNDLLAKQLNDSSESLDRDERSGKIDTDIEKIVSDKIVAKPIVQTIKNISKNKPAVLKSLRSTYHKGRKEIILSDTNSEQCTRISLSPTLNIDANKRPSDESETLQENGNDVVIENAVNSNDIKKKSRSKSPNRNYNSSEKIEEKRNAKDFLFVDENDSANAVKDRGTNENFQTDIGDTKNVDLITNVRSVNETRTKKSGKSKSNDRKTGKETVTKIGDDLKSEISRNDQTKCESKGKESADDRVDCSNRSKSDVPKGLGSKNKTGCSKAEKKEESEEPNSKRKSFENDIKPGKTVSKAKDEGSNSNKQKKETKRLIVSTRRRKPVHLEDSSTSSNVVMNPNSFSDNNSVNNSETSTNNDPEIPNSVDKETSIEHEDYGAQNTFANNDAAVDEDESELSKVGGKLTV